MLNVRLIFIYALIVAVASSPILAVGTYVHQDGLPHLYNAWLMSEILNGNGLFTELFQFNSFAVPNSSGHWLMVALLQIFSPAVVTKIIVILCFAGLVACVAWLRYRTAVASQQPAGHWESGGGKGLVTSMLIGAVLGFNWMWLSGFYNFMIGVIAFVIAVALVAGWRGRTTVTRALLLSLVLLLAYFSHLVSFAVTAGSVLFLALFSREDRLRNTVLTIAAILPVVPLVLIFKSLSTDGGEFFPVWRSLQDGLSAANLIHQLRTADPLVLISRRAFPFSSASSPLFAFFTALLWLFVAYAVLAFGTIRDYGFHAFRDRTTLLFTILFLGSVLTAIVAPDDFGLLHGGILRERVMLCGLVFFVPVFSIDRSRALKRIAQACLVFVILFQTAVVWEYAFYAEGMAAEYVTSQQALTEGDSIVTIAIVEDGLRLHSMPEPQFSMLNGMGRNIVVWDNYELGHYLFPLVTNNDDDRAFVWNLANSHAISRDPRESVPELIAKLDRTLAAHNGKVTKVIFWRRNEMVENVVYKWFDPNPIFENGRVRVLKHR